MCQRCESNIFLLKAKFASSGNMGWLVQQAKYSKIISNIQIDSESVIIQPLVGTSVFTFMWVHMHILWTCLICVDMASDLPPLWSYVKISMHFPSRLLAFTIRTICTCLSVSSWSCNRVPLLWSSWPASCSSVALQLSARQTPGEGLQKTVWVPTHAVHHLPAEHVPNCGTWSADPDPEQVLYVSKL